MSTQTKSTLFRKLQLALLFALGVLLLGCGKQAPARSSPSSAAAPAQDPYAVALLSGCANGPRQLETITSSEEGRITMRMSVMDCDKYLSLFPNGPDASQVRSLRSEAAALEDRFSAVAEIEGWIERGDFDDAKERIGRYKGRLSLAEETRLKELLAEREAAHDAVWLPTSLDVHGFARGGCARSPLIRNLSEARSWALQNGAIQVLAIREEPTKVVIDHFDGLLQAQGTRTFWRDMPTCLAARGQ
jgi:hypothetical protein